MTIFEDLWGKPKTAPAPAKTPAAPTPKPAAKHVASDDREPTPDEIRRVQRYLSKKAGAARSAKKAAASKANGSLPPKPGSAPRGRTSKLKAMLEQSVKT